MLKVKDYYELHTLHLVHRILHGFAPIYLNDLLVLRSSASDRVSRAHRLSLQAPRVGRDTPEKSFSVKAYRLWSALEPQLCLNENVLKFNSEIHVQMLKRY